jgi:dihydropteroate synthase type 2
MAPGIFGIVNLTPDSFSDGGLYLDPARAIAHARQLALDGADVIDLGPASSHPSLVPVDAHTEIERLQPVLDALHAERIPISVDSWRAETQRFALSRGVAWLNDVRGFAEPALYAELASASCRMIVMHASPAGVWSGWPALLRFFEQRLEALVGAGIAEARIALDPGMGLFLSDQPEPSLEVLQRLPELRQRFGREVLVSVSRKSFLGALTGRGPRERGPATLAAELWAAARGADWIRTHDARALRDALRTAEALSRGSRSC